MARQPKTIVKLILKLAALLVLLLLSALAYQKLIESPYLEIKQVLVAGAVKNEEETNIVAVENLYLQQNILQIDITEVKEGFEKLAWIRAATVQRLFPNKLKVSLQEHNPVAYWGKKDSPLLLNSYAEIFSANLGLVDNLALPYLDGPDDSSAEVLELYLKLQPLFKVTGAAIKYLTLNDKGSWSLELKNGTKLALGKGNTAELNDRVYKFLLGYQQLVKKNKLSNRTILESADLRYADGFAIKFKQLEIKQG